jgi:hypothetical protein
MTFLMFADTEKEKDDWIGESILCREACMVVVITSLRGWTRVTGSVVNRC